MTLRSRWPGIAGVDLGAVILALASMQTCAEPGSDTNRRVVLPATVTPIHYRISVTPDARALRFQGSVEIDVEVHQTTDRIVLNSADIGIDSARLSGEADPLPVEYDASAQTVSLVVGHAIEPGPRTLSLSYHGTIFEQSSGLFRLDYETATGKATALFTDFESAYARRFVPSWDEPGRKATFELTATVPAELTPVSNMPVAASQDLGNGLKRVRFARTPKMSSYLLFLGVGDFERIHRDVEGVDVGIVVKRGDTARAGYALDAATKILHYYNDYFGVRYPLPKLDLVAGPGTSQRFGAMENWGAIFYFESYLLVDPQLSTQTDKKWVYEVIAHEMAHQWFGDLVTMAWWDDLWLNEGFASWMQLKATDHLHPEWKVWQENLGSTQQVMATDARDGTHPVVTPIHDIVQADGAFDAITYGKGQAVIRMLEAHLGEQAFRAGVRRYVRSFAYDNAVTEDFWKSMDRSGKKPITRIARDYTLQSGVPMVSIESAKCVAGHTNLVLSQSRYVIDDGSTPSNLWHVPVSASTLGGAVATSVVAGARPHALRVAGCGPVILNAGQAGYFRSRYDDQDLRTTVLHFSQIAPVDQLGFFSDLSALAMLGHEPVSAMLNLMSRLGPATDPQIVAEVASTLESLDNLYTGRPSQARFRAFARDVLGPFFSTVGWDHVTNEADTVAQLREDLIDALVQLDDAEVIRESRKRFDAFVADPTGVDPGARHNLLAAVAARADPAIWDRLHQSALAANTETERLEYYRLLAAPEDSALIDRALTLALSDEVAVTTGPAILRAAARLHSEQVFDFAVLHWEEISSKLEPGSRSMYIPRLANNAFDPGVIGRLDAFASAHIPEQARQDVRKADSKIRYQARIRQERLPEIDRWLNSRGHE